MRSVAVFSLSQCGRAISRDGGRIVTETVGRGFWYNFEIESEARRKERNEEVFERE
jgi:hypothetical protein